MFTPKLGERHFAQVMAGNRVQRFIRLYVKHNGVGFGFIYFDMRKRSLTIAYF